MAYPIPKIEWLNYSTTGDTNTASPVILNIPSTTLIQVGMYVKAAGIPTTAKVISKTVSTVTLDEDATATATGVALEFYFKIDFDFPPVEPDGAQLDADETVSISRNGKRQVSIAYIEEKRSLRFSFLTEALKLEVDNFLKTHALYGNPFRYYEDKTLLAYIDYEMQKLGAVPRKIAGKTATEYTWDYALTFRRAL